MSEPAITGRKISRDDRNLPKIGTGKKITRKSREDMDRREREVFELRRDGKTYQEIANILLEKAEELFARTGKRVPFFHGISSHTADG